MKFFIESLYFLFYNLEFHSIICIVWVEEAIAQTGGESCGFTISGLGENPLDLFR